MPEDATNGSGRIRREIWAVINSSTDHRGVADKSGALPAEPGGTDLIDASSRPLRPWMSAVLRFAGCFNLVAGAAMVSLYHEGYELLGVPKPELVLPVQIMGILVGLFGLGYHWVASRPMENRDILRLGFLAKLICSLTAYWYVLLGPLGIGFATVVFFADVIYLPLFWIILRHLDRAARRAAADA